MTGNDVEYKAHALQEASFNVSGGPTDKNASEKL